ncbi:tyrosine-type recombinase/integrase [Corynebacterium bouchesdurhonense]|uniref:tyrosine-type recombinase/integrase n=1 Tax=Corynebacterium bouchesdurhonense TaxID=1720192 RepID=UPI0008364428|nr:site-specific integrase [Corynebacterium bouchesdurhonense]
MAIQRRQTKTGQVRWVARWRDKGGKEHSRSFDTKREAKTFLADVEVRAARGVNTAPQKITVLELYNRWLDSRPLRDSSRTLYEHTRDKNLVPLHNYPAVELSNTDVQAWANQLANGRPWVSSSDAGLERAGVTMGLRHLRSAYEYGRRAELVARNPVHVQIDDEAVDPVEIPTVDEIRRVVDLVREGGAPYEESSRSKFPEKRGTKYTAYQRPRPDIADMMLVAVGTGARVSEVAGFNVSEVDFDSGVLLVRKQLGKQPPRSRVELKTRRSRRDLPIPEELVPMLEERTAGRAPEDLLFTTKTGRPINTSHASVVVKRAAVAADAERVHFHALRHYYASSLLTSGVPVQDVAAVMGHTVAMTMKTYAHVLAGYQERVRAASSLAGCGIFAGSPHLRVVEGGA